MPIQQNCLACAYTVKLRFIKAKWYVPLDHESTSGGTRGSGFYDLEGTLVSTNLVTRWVSMRVLNLFRSITKSTTTLLSVPVAVGDR